MVLLLAPGPPAGSTDRVVYRPPTDAPVVDPFRPPPGPYASGNRGIEYRTVPGTPVRAAADGEVTFAGPVAGTLHVTIRHADGVRTSSSYLATIAVVRSQTVRRGQPVGTAAARLHVGARRGDTYIDPASLWSRGPPRVVLVPLDGAGGPEPPAQVAPALSGPALPPGWHRFGRWLR